MDTRPGVDNVGSKSSPLGPGETFALVARGAQGKCNLPTDALALAMNVTAVGGTEASYLSVFPSDSPLPLASNLNWVSGQPPTPNKVDVGLSAAGAVSFYNNAGSVHVVADVSGYYVAHDHDDRYYRKDQIDAALATKGAKPPTTFVLAPSDFHKSDFFDGVDRSSGVIRIDPASLVRSDASGPAAATASLDLPHGATLTSVTAHVQTTTGLGGGPFKLQFRVVARPAGSGVASNIAAWSSVGTASTTEAATVSSFSPATIDRTAFGYALVVLFPSTAAVFLLDVVVSFTLP
ncbi:MAG: hypothetical protein ABIR32_01550 [Ilumatobacteraceae bacterium]